MSETEWKPCPFCGGVAIRDHRIGLGGSRYRLGIACHDCGLSFDISDAKWNTRSESDALRREKLQFMELYKLMPDIENQYEDRLFYHLANKLNILDCTQRQLAAAQKEIEELKRDKERIDYLDRRECVTWERRPTHQPDGIELRSALDAAIAQAKGAE